MDHRINMTCFQPSLQFVTVWNVDDKLMVVINLVVLILWHEHVFAISQVNLIKRRHVAPPFILHIQRFQPNAQESRLNGVQARVDCAYLSISAQRTALAGQRVIICNDGTPIPVASDSWSDKTRNIPYAPWCQRGGRPHKNHGPGRHLQSLRHHSISFCQSRSC